MLTWRVWVSMSNTVDDNNNVIAIHYGEGDCLSTDAKPTEGIFNGSRLLEMDTGAEYRFESVSRLWLLWTGSGGGSSAPTSQMIMLSSANWIDNQQTVTVYGVSANEGAQLIQPVPSSESREEYEETGVECTAQAENSLTFTCESVPESDLTVYVVITEVSA